MDKIFFKAKHASSNIDLKNYDSGSIITFFDKKTKLPPDKSECNQIGILMENNEVLFSRNRKVIEINANKIKATKMFIIPIADKELSLKIRNYFKINGKDYRRFNAGLGAIVRQRINFFDYPVIFPELTKWNSEDEYERSWGNLVAQLQPADCICTFNEKNMISRFICFIDKGPWSHTAIYIGDGEISEAISCGVVKRKIDVYKNKHIHIGIYRSLDLSADQKKDIIGWSLSSIGVKYDYMGVILLGLKKIFGIHSNKPSPNDLICLHCFYLVYYI